MNDVLSISGMNESSWWERAVVWCYAMLFQLPFKYAYSLVEESDLPLQLRYKALRLQKFRFYLVIFRLRWVLRLKVVHVLFLSFLVWLKFDFLSEHPGSGSSGSE